MHLRGVRIILYCGGNRHDMTKACCRPGGSRLVDRLHTDKSALVRRPRSWSETIRRIGMYRNESRHMDPAGEGNYPRHPPPDDKRCAARHS